MKHEKWPVQEHKLISPEPKEKAVGLWISMRELHLGLAL